MAISALVLAGEKSNLLEDALLTVSSEDSLFPKGRLFNGRPSEPFAFAAAGTDDAITADLDLIEDGGFEDGITPAWTILLTGTGTQGDETTIVKTGAHALRLNGGAAGTAAARQDVVARAGARYTINVQIRAATGVQAFVFIQNRLTGKFVDSVGAWSLSPAVASTSTTDTWENDVVSFVVEDFATSLTSLVPLRITCFANGNGNTYYDDISFYPSWDFISVHSHNVEPLIVPELRSSTDGFSASDDLVSALTVDQPTFYHWESSSPVDRRYAQLKLVGKNPSAIRIGELVLGQALALARTYDHGSELAYLEDEIVNESRSRDVWVHSLANHPRRTYQANWSRGLLTANWTELKDELYRRSRGRRFPLVLVPDATRPEALHCRIDSSYTSQRRFVELWSASMIFTENPFGSA